MANGLPEISLPVSLANSYLNGPIEIAADETDILAKVNEDNGISGILTDRNPLFSGNPGIFFKLFKNVDRHRGLLPGDSPVKGLQDVLSQIIVGLHAETLHPLCHFAHANLSHRGLLLLQ